MKDDTIGWEQEFSEIDTNSQETIEEKSRKMVNKRALTEKVWGVLGDLCFSGLENEISRRSR